MTVIYQELEPFPCQWLGNLITAGHIAQGEVIPGDIKNVRAEDIEHATQAHFFAGIGVWSLALRLAGIPDDFPVWTGSCPCQPFSNAGRGKGTEDERHLFPVWRDLIAKCMPPIIFGEQVASPAGREWFGSVRLSLEALGYSVGGADLCAAGVGAPHRRQRLFFVAHAGDERFKGLCASWVHDQGERRDNDAGRSAPVDGRLGNSHSNGSKGHAGTSSEKEGGIGVRTVGHTDLTPGPVGGTRPVGDASGGARQQVADIHAGSSPTTTREARKVSVQRDVGEPLHGFWAGADWVYCTDEKARPVEPGAFPLADGTAARVGVLRAYGNAIVPQVAAAFIRASLEASIS